MSFKISNVMDDTGIKFWGFRFSLLFFTGKSEDDQSQIKPQNRKWASCGVNVKLEVHTSIFFS